MFSSHPNTQFISIRALTLATAFAFSTFTSKAAAGFFDPSNYIANRVFTSYWLERDKYYTYLEGYFDCETFRRNGVRLRQLHLRRLRQHRLQADFYFGDRVQRRRWYLRRRINLGLQLLRYRTESSVQILSRGTSPAE